MKKSVLIFAMASMLCSTAVMAQKVDLEGIVSKMEKCDTDSANPKKGAKAATWITRGEAYIDSILEPTKSLFLGMDVMMMEVACGKTKNIAAETVSGKEYQVYSYPYFKAYVQNGKVAAWTMVDKKVIRKDALDVAVDSFNKAVELDSSSASKIKSSMDAAINYYKVLGNCAVELNDMSSGADAFVTVSELSELSYNGGKADPSILFYAGYMLSVDGVNNPSSFVKGEKLLNKAMKSGYLEYEASNTEMDDANRGNIYYYLFSCAYAQREGNADKLNDAKAYLVEGVEKFPANERIFEGLMQLYTNEKGLGDPSDLLPNVDAAIAKDAKNFNAWFSRGRIYYAMENYDECIASFKKVVELNPSFFEGNFYLGLFYMLKADNMLDEINSGTYTDQSVYNADIDKLNLAYAECIPCFEAAYELKPTDKTTLEYLKQLCFRLRDMPGVMEKYTKYNELLQNL